MSSGREPHRSGVLLGLLLILAGCTPAVVRAPEPAPDDAREALERLTARARAFADLRTLAEISLERDGQRYHLSGVLLLRAPASLRFEALSPIGTPWLIVVIHEGRLTVYDTRRHAATVGAATAATARRTLGLPFAPEELVATLAGHARLPSAVRVTWGAEEADGRPLELEGAGERHRLWIDPATGVLIRRETLRGGTRLDLAYYWAPDGRPLGLDLASMPATVRAWIRYREPVVGAGVALERFELGVPPSVRLEPPAEPN